MGVSEGARLGILLGALSGSSDGTPERFRLGDPAGSSVGNNDGGSARIGRSSAASISKPARLRTVPFWTCSTRITALRAEAEDVNVMTRSTPSALRRALRARATTSKSEGASCKIVASSVRMRQIPSGVYSSRDPSILSSTSARGNSVAVRAAAQPLHYPNSTIGFPCVLESGMWNDTMHREAAVARLSQLDRSRGRM